MKHLKKFNEQSRFIHFSPFLGDMEEVIVDHLQDFNNDIKDALWDVIDEFDLTLYLDQVYSHSGVPETHIYPSIRFYRKDYNMLDIITYGDYQTDSFDFSYETGKKKLELVNNDHEERIKELMNQPNKYQMMLEVYPILMFPDKRDYEVKDFFFNSINMTPYRRIYSNWQQHNRKMDPNQLFPIEKRLMETTQNIKSQIGDFSVDLVSYNGDPEITFKIYIPLT